MDVEKAREIAEASKLSLDASNPSDVLLTLLEESGGDREIVRQISWNLLVAAITARAEKGKSSLMFEPFSAIPRKYQSEDSVQYVLDRLTGFLEASEYKNVQWDKRDGRVILRLEW
jgi:hypothetical protein